MASRVQTANTGDGQAGSIAYASNVTAGNLGILWVRISIGDGTLTAVTDTQGNTWTRVDTQAVGGNTAEMWYAVFGTSGANTVSLTGATARMVIEEVSGLTSAALDATAKSTGSSSAAASGSFTAAANSWVIAGLVLANYPSIDPTPGSGFTHLVALGAGNELRYYAEDRDFAAGGSINGQFTLPESNSWGVIAASFVGSGGAGSTGRGRLIGGKLVGGNLLVRRL